MNSAQALVTGGTGFIGRHIVWQLLQRGSSVRVLTRDAKKAARLFGGSVELLSGNLRSGMDVQRAVRGVESIYHCGGFYAFGGRYKNRLREINVAGTENVMAAAWKYKPGKVVHISSAGILAGKHYPLCETDYPTHSMPGCPYKSSKWESEQVVRQWAARGIPVVTVNPTCPLGSGDEKPTPTGRIVLDFLNGKFPFSTRTGINLIDVEDLARGIIAAHDRGRIGERYILGHHNIMLTDLLNLLQKETGLPAPTMELPWSVVALAGFFGEILHSVGLAGADSQLCLETSLQAGRIQFFNHSKAMEELGWAPASELTHILRQSIAFFQARIEGNAPVRVPSNVC